MTAWTRVRAHGGLWLLVALLAAGVTFLAGSSGPALTGIEDRAVQRTTEAAPYPTRDLMVRQQLDRVPGAVADPSGSGTGSAAGGDAITPDGMQRFVQRRLPSAIEEVVEETLAYQRTGMSVGWGGSPPVAAALTGPGVTTEPELMAPVVSLHYHPGQNDLVTIVDGRAPATDPEGDVLEVMVTREVAQRLSLEAGGEYTLHPGVSKVLTYDLDWFRMESNAQRWPVPDEHVLRVTGVFEADDPAAPVWQHPIPGPLTVTEIHVPPGPGDQPWRVLRAGLVTDADGFAYLEHHQMTDLLEPRSEVRVRLAADQLDADWTREALPALSEMFSDPQLSHLAIGTGLRGMVEGFHREAVAVRAVAAVAVAGMVATLLGLLALAARLAVERRRDELLLLRARGGSTAAVWTHLSVESLAAGGPLVLLGWLAGRAAAGVGLTMPSAGELLGLLVLAVVALQVVPVAGVAAVRRFGLAEGRREGRRSPPVRLTVELSVVVLAALGVVLVHLRGLTAAGVDPYLSTVPVLLAVGAGVLAVRAFPWPLRALAAGVRGRRGVVGFVGLAQAGRAAPGAALALLVLVTAMAVGGFAGAVNSQVSQARDAAAVREVWAHVRVDGGDLPAELVAEVGQVPGVTAVAAVDRRPYLVDLTHRTAVRGQAVVVVDATAYQQVAAALGVADAVPPEILTATPGDNPVPVLADQRVARRAEVALQVGEDRHPVAVVGDVTGLPGPAPDEGWVLVPRQALPEPDHVDQLLVVGAEADPAAIEAVVRGYGTDEELTVSSVAGFRERFEESGFNDGLTLVFVVGTVGGAAGGVLAVALALVVQARARGRVLSVLRTMGLSSGQARGLLLVELLPVASVAVLVGAVVGVVLPLVLAPALGLEAFTAGQPLPAGVDPTTVALLGGLVAALVLAGVTVQAVVNRWRGLGGVLRVD